MRLMMNPSARARLAAIAIVLMTACLAPADATAAGTDYSSQPIARPPLAPGRVAPQHAYLTGAPAYWPGTLHWRYNPADTPWQLNGDVAATIQQIIDASGKWTAVCGVHIAYDGETAAVPGTLVNGQPDSVNVIGWRVPSGGVMAATHYWIGSFGGDDVIVDADIAIDPNTALSQEQLASIITHEWGHAIGLGHSPVANTLMSGPPDSAYGPGIDLTPDDVQGCRCLYGPPAGVQAGFLCSLPSKIDFGAVTVGTNSTPRQVIVTNDGTAALTIGSIQMEGSDFAVPASQCLFGTTLQSGGTCTFDIVAAPTVTDLRRAEAIVNTSEGPYRIPLFAEGVPAPPPTLNFEGAWWNAPAETESGWGLTLAHQDDVIFATWFTYAGNGKAMWVSMTAFRTGTYTYEGALYRTTGPSLAAVPFDPNLVQRVLVGSASLTFTDANSGIFAYTMDGVSQAKSITRQVFGPLPVCTFGGGTNFTNLQGNWWTAGGGESGWGIYFTHQGDNIFASWFTYDVDGEPIWLSATAMRTGVGTYRGDIIRTTGPPFNAVPFDSQSVTRATVGALGLTFANGNGGTLDYTVTIGNPPSSVSRSTQLTRLVFRPPGTTCQ